MNRAKLNPFQSRYLMASRMGELEGNANRKGHLGRGVAQAGETSSFFLISDIVEVLVCVSNGLNICILFLFILTFILLILLCICPFHRLDKGGSANKHRD